MSSLCVWPYVGTSGDDTYGRHHTHVLIAIKDIGEAKVCLGSHS